MLKNSRIIFSFFISSLFVSCSNDINQTKPLELNNVVVNDTVNNSPATIIPSTEPTSTPTPSDYIVISPRGNISTPVPKESASSTLPNLIINKSYPMRLLSIMDRDGNEKKDLIRADEIDYFSFSPDFSKILFISPKDHGIYLINKDGTNLKFIETYDFIENVAPKYIVPKWFSDNKRITFSSKGSVYILDTETMEKKKIYSIENADLNRYNLDPIPLSNDTKISFYERPFGKYDNILINIDGSGRKKITSVRGSVFKRSYDGKYLAFYGNTYLFPHKINPTRGITIVDNDGNFIAANKEVTSEFDWTEDNKFVYVDSYGDKTKEIVDTVNIINMDGTGKRELSRVVSNKKVSGQVVSPTSYSLNGKNGKVAVVMFRCWTQDPVTGDLTYYSDDEAVYTGKMNFALHTYTMNLNGSDKKYLRVDNGFYTLFPTWIDNGKSLFFQNNLLPADYFSGQTVKKSYFQNPYIPKNYFYGTKLVD